MKKTVAVVKRQVLYKCKWGLMALIVFAMAAAGCSDLSSEQEAKKAVSTGGNEQESRSGDEEKGTEKAQGAEDADQTDEETETADVSDRRAGTARTGWCEDYIEGIRCRWFYGSRVKIID